MSACRGAAGHPWAVEAAHDLLEQLRNASPVLALTRTASVASMPMISSISTMTRSGSAEGRSILLMTAALPDPVRWRCSNCDALRLNALRGVHHQQRAIAGSEAARDFV